MDGNRWLKGKGVTNILCFQGEFFAQSYIHIFKSDPLREKYNLYQHNKQDEKES